MRRPRTEARPRRADYAKGLTNRGPLQKGGQRRKRVPTIPDALRWWARGACHRARVRATRWLCPPYKLRRRHCEERSNPPRRTRMDCFVALLLAMTTLHCRCDKATRRANQQNLSIPSRKNISLNPSGKSKVKSRPSRPTRGAYRDRHGRRVRDAVAAAMPGAQDVRRADLSVSEHSAPDESIVADGKTVWSWRPWLASSRRRSAKPYRDSLGLQSGGDGGKRNSSPGRARYKP